MGLNFLAKALSVSWGTPAFEQNVASFQKRRFPCRDRLANANSARCRVEVLFLEWETQAISFRSVAIDCDSHETRTLKIYLKSGLCISGNSYITILPPIPTAGMTKDDLPKLMEQVYTIMNKTFVESTHECLADHIGSLKEEWYYKNDMKWLALWAQLNKFVTSRSWSHDQQILFTNNTWDKYFISTVFVKTDTYTERML